MFGVVVLFVGELGVGKLILLFDVVVKWVKVGRCIFYVIGEELVV